MKIKTKEEWERAEWQKDKATFKQLRFLRKLGWKGSKELTKGEAIKLTAKLLKNE